MLKKSLFIGTFFLLFIGLSDYGYGCHGGKPPHIGCGGVVDDLTINLTGGTFVLDLTENDGNPLVVNLDKKGRIFTSDQHLIMYRPDDGTLESMEWDAVFAACKMTMPTLKIPIGGIDFGDDLRIAANAGLILLRLFDVRVDEDVVISLTLFGDSLDYEDNLSLPTMEK